MTGYPKLYEVPTRNRYHSNQPGGLAKPTVSAIGDKVRMYTDELRNIPVQDVEVDMDYDIGSQPDTPEGPTFG